MPRRCPAMRREILSSPLFVPSHAEDAPAGRTTITNASRRACTRLYASERASRRASERARAHGSSLSSRSSLLRGRRSSNSREIQNKRSAGMCDRYWPRATVPGPTAARGRGVAHALAAVHPETASRNRPRTHARRSLTSRVFHRPSPRRTPLAAEAQNHSCRDDKVK